REPCDVAVDPLERSKPFAQGQSNPWSSTKKNEPTMVTERQPTRVRRRLGVPASAHASPPKAPPKYTEMASRHSDPERADQITAPGSGSGMKKCSSSLMVE